VLFGEMLRGCFADLSNGVRTIHLRIFCEAPLTLQALFATVNLCVDAHSLCLEWRAKLSEVRASEPREKGVTGLARTQSRVGS
jgi:hypothetical protein